MKKLSLASMLLLGSVAAFAQIDHENLINGVGGHASGDRSFLETTPAETIFGYGAQTTATNTMADDFTVAAGGFIIQSIRLYTYQTGATAPTITAANWSIGAAPVIASGLTVGTPITNGWWNPNGVGVYRTTNADTTSTNRRIQFVDIDIVDTFFGAGTYFLSWNMAGTLASGPWQPHNPTSLAAFGQNGQQSLTNLAFAPVIVGAVGTPGADLPFTLNGTAVPEPATMAVLGLGVAALLRRRKKA